MDRETLLYYQEARDGQLLEEGISEAGAMSSFIAAGTAQSTYGTPMIPFYTFYSMFGFQRIGDLMWAAADSKAKGFLLGATAGRTTLNGEGLQHADGHSHVLASTVPPLLTYDPAFAYEIAVIVQDGLRRMYKRGEDVFYYLTLYNENQEMPAMPPGSSRASSRGSTSSRASTPGKRFAPICSAAARSCSKRFGAQEILASRYDVAADVWSATSYNLLRRDAQQAQRWNLLHPGEAPRKSYLESLLEPEEGVFVAVSDYMKIVPDQIAPWVPGGLLTLGTDGFGRSDTRPRLRRYFEVDAESVVVATLYALAQKGRIKMSVVARAMRELHYNPAKPHPEMAV